MSRIALVEDNPDNRMLVVALLEDDYDIDEYEDGPSALTGMESARPDLVLLDISLPGMDGPAILSTMKKGPLASIPTVALTAHAMAGDREKFLDLGFDDYLSKPIVDEDLLYSMIRRLLSAN